MIQIITTIITSVCTLVGVDIATAQTRIAITVT